MRRTRPGVKRAVPVGPGIAILIRLYPRTFRERFGAGMAQTFHDLCLEHRDARWGRLGLTLWIFFETSMGIVRETLVASQVVEGWIWDAKVSCTCMYCC